MWFVLDRVDLDFVDTAPHHVCREVLLDVPADRAFDVLTGDRWREWFPDLQDITWYPPRGVGGTRYLRLHRSEVHETFLAWEPGRRLAFSVDRSTVPFIKAMLVEFRLTPASAGNRTQVALCWHYTLPIWWRPMHASVRRRVEKILSAALAALKHFVER